MELLAVIQQAIQDNIAAQKLTDLAIGTVTSTSPLKISFSVELPSLGEPAIILTEAVKAWDETVRLNNSEQTTIIHHYGLNVNDKVIALRVEHGQRFIILSRI